MKKVKIQYSRLRVTIKTEKSPYTKGDFCILLNELIVFAQTRGEPFMAGEGIKSYQKLLKINL